jgi:hypothetical protein
MSLSLPKSFVNVCPKAFSCMNAKLVERSEYRHSCYFSISLPESLDGGMEVLADCLWASVPKSNFFSKAIRKRIVRQRE